MIRKASGGAPTLSALLYELCLLTPRFFALRENFFDDAAEALKPHTPLPYIKWALQPDSALHAQWTKIFRANIHEHRLLPHPDDDELPPLFDLAKVPAIWLPKTTVSVGDVRHKVATQSHNTPWQRPPAQATATLALERLLEHTILDGVEMRHEASLSPIALLRQWRLAIEVETSTNNHALQGSAITYGRGLSLADARASYAMEMVERASAYPSMKRTAKGIEIAHRMHPCPVTVASYSELAAQGIEAVNPNDFPLEAPYEDEPLHWIAGHSPRLWGNVTVLVPMQMVFLFCNPGEVSLYTAPGSTGLACGNIMEEAKVAALTEIIERDAEATMPYHQSQCFTLTTKDPKLHILLEDYKARGIHVQFQDITTRFGVPCYKAFVTSPQGGIARATGAGLNGPRAIVSCLTETPYPYPNGTRSGPPLPNLPIRAQEDLPDESLGDPIRDLALLEQMFIANNTPPVYVDITRADLQFPVVRALVPGMELTADFTPFTKINPRLYKAYLEMFT